MTRIEIPLSKTKLFFIICGCALFVVLGFYMILKIAYAQHRYSPLLLQGIGFISVVFFGAIGIFGSKKLFDRTPGLIIDDKGITDNSNATNAGLIAWKDITHVNVSSVKSSKFLSIHISNPEKYIDRASKMKARMLKFNMKISGTPLCISAGALECNFEELEKSVTSAFEEYQRNTVGNGLNS